MTDWIDHYESGTAKLRMKRFREALRDFRKAESALEPDTNPLLAGTLYLRISAAHMEGDQTDEAVAAARKAISIAQHHTDELDGQELLVASSKVLASLLGTKGALTDGIAILEELIVQLKSLGVAELAVEPLEMLSNLYRAVGDQSTAAAVLARADVVRKQARQS